MDHAAGDRCLVALRYPLQQWDWWGGKLCFAPSLGGKDFLQSKPHGRLLAGKVPLTVRHMDGSRVQELTENGEIPALNHVGVSFGNERPERIYIKPYGCEAFSSGVSELTVDGRGPFRPK